MPDLSFESSENLKEMRRVRNVFPETWLWINLFTGYIYFDKGLLVHFVFPTLSPAFIKTG